MNAFVIDFPLSETLRRVLSGTGECAESGWKFLGLSIAGWSLVWLVLAGAFAVLLTVIAWRRGRSGDITRADTGR